MILNKRQQKIYDFLLQKEFAKRGEIEEYINFNFDNTSKITILRDIEVLIKQNLIEKSGTARSTVYSVTDKNNIFKTYDVEKYFNKEADRRKVKYPQFNFAIFDKLKNIFTKNEIENLNKINNKYQSAIKNMPYAILKKEYERLLIELSWKSSKIEGNTYTLLDTETLIKQNIEAKGKKREEGVMILNHKNALSFIFENKDYFKRLDLKKVQELHYILTKDLEVNKGFRKAPVRITGTNYKPLDNIYQIQEAMEKLIALLNSTANVIEKAFIIVIMISYIQPFEDGNKRTARILANAVFYSNNYCPISYRSVDETEYKKAMILFYENNSVQYFKELFIQQFKFAVDEYFNI